MRRFWIHAAGHRLEAAEWGPESGPAILLLHEGLGCVAMWRDFPERLAATTGRRILAYSRAGYGASDPVVPPRGNMYMHVEAETAIAPVLQEMGVLRAILLGHSDGASIAALYAGTHQDQRVRGLVLLAPHLFVEPATITGIEDARQRFLAGDLRARLARYHSDADGAFWGWNRAWLDPAFRDWNICAEAAGIGVPTLVVQGLADPYGTVAQVEVLQAAAVAQAVLLPGVGHSPHLQAPDATLAAVAKFAAEVLRD